MVNLINRGSSFLFIDTVNRSDFVAVQVNDSTVEQFLKDDAHNWDVSQLNMQQVREKLAQFIETFSIF